MKLNLGQDSEARFGQDFDADADADADVLTIGRDSEDEI